MRRTAQTSLSSFGSSHFVFLRNMPIRAKPAMPTRLPPADPDPGASAGHSRFEASWAATLTRSGQIHSWRASAPPNSPYRQPRVLHTSVRPGWNERIPVWERRIPQWQTALNPAERVGPYGLPYNAPVAARSVRAPSPPSPPEGTEPNRSRARLT